MIWDTLFNLFFNGKKKQANASKTILVIDDGEVERRFLEGALTKGGYQVLVAASGEEGLKIAQEKHPELILLDFIMPGIHGDVVCRRMKDDASTRDIPVIFLTGSVKPSNIIDSYDSGAEYYLAKPISSGELLRQLEMIFKEKEQLLESENPA